MRKKVDLSFLKKHLPQIIVRSEIETIMEKVMPGMVTRRSMEAHDNRGTGPKANKTNGKTWYTQNDYIIWLERNTTEMKA